jgi:hypothetical protein
MKTQAALTARKLMNLYRSAFAIEGGWGAVNAVLTAEADDAVVAEVEKLPCGKNLGRHISNLKRGLTKPDSIDPELTPYNGMMQPRPDDVDDAAFAALRGELENFQPDKEHLERIKNLPIVRQFGGRWPAGVLAILRDDSLVAIWRNVVQSDRAMKLWGRAAEILSSSPSDLLRAEVQADMPEYETYLPMFGKDGLDILSRLRQFVI